MRRQRQATITASGVALLLAIAASDLAPKASATIEPVEQALSTAGGPFSFDPILPIVGDAACLDRGAITTMQTDEVFQLPAGFSQRVIGRQKDLATTSPEVSFDMLTLNETGPNRGRYLYRSHEVGWFAAFSMIDLVTGASTLIAERADWEAFDGLVWTPHRTLLMGEERIVQAHRDPDYPDVERGLMYEYFPKTGQIVARPALGARSHEGIQFDRKGNVYGISESRGLKNAGQSGHSGAIFKFVPDRRGDLSSGQLYALRVLSGRTGAAVWERLAMDPVTFDSDTAAQEAGATGWDRPEDIAIATITNDIVIAPRAADGTVGTTSSDERPGRSRQVLFVAVTENSLTEPAYNNGLVLKIELNGKRAFVSNYVEPGVNVQREIGHAFDPDAGVGFDDPDNLAIGPNGDLYIAEDQSPGDIWVARGPGAVADQVELFARLRECVAEPSGIYFDRRKRTLFVNSMHAGLNGGDDLTIAITRDR